MAGRRTRTAWVGLLVAVSLLTSPLVPAVAYATTTDVVDVRDFGARGDGVTEDTAAFQAAVDAAAGKTLSIPAGTYRVGRIVITQPTNVVGAGAGATLLKAKDYINDNVFDVERTNNVNFSDFEIDGNRFRISGGKPCGINFDYSSDCLVQRVNIHDCDKTGVCIYEGSTRITVRDSRFANNENDIEFHKATYSQAINNECRNARTENIASYEEPYGPQVTGHNVMAYNKCYDSETGLSFQRSHYNDAHDNYVENCMWGLVIVGLRDDVNQNTYKNAASNNVIVGGPRSTGTGILTDDRTYDATLTGNTVRDWPLGPMGPVRLQGRHTVFVNNRIENPGQQCEISANDVVFSGNTISRSGKQGLLVTQDVANVRIENNTIEYCNDLGIQTIGAIRDGAIVGNTLHSNCRTASGPGLWANSGSVWTNTVFANNRLYDDQSVRTQTGVYLRDGGSVAVAGNSVSGSSTWPSASSGAVVDIRTAASDGHSRWTCTSAGRPGTWSASDAGAPPAATEPPSDGTGSGNRGRKVKRVAGTDRYSTAVAISSSSFGSAGAVVLATGAQYPDALAAAGLAGTLKAPLLLTPPAALRDDVVAEIARLGATKVVIVGGPLAVSPYIEQRLRSSGLSVERLAGDSRYATSAEVARRVAAGGTVDTVIVARGDDFADALSVSPLAYGKQVPVLLTRPGALPPETLAALDEMAPKRIVIVGGTSAVSAAVENALRSRCGDVTRVSGTSRYGTSAAVARFALSNGWAKADRIGIAAGDRFPDALGGGAACGNAGGLLLLTPPPALSGETRAALAEVMTDTSQIDLYGGVSAVAAGVESDVRALAQVQ